MGVYTLTIQGTTVSGSSASVSFNLIVTAPIIVASTTSPQLYDLTTKSGTVNYAIPSFTTVPNTIESMIRYSDVSLSKPNGVTFSSTLRKFDWSGVIST